MDTEQALASHVDGGKGCPPEEGPERSIAFYDIETEEWDRFVLGGFISSSGLYQEFSWIEGEAEPGGRALFEAILAEGPGVDIYAWNGGRYDFNWFLQHAREQEITCEIGSAGARITRLQVKGGPTLKDAMALVPLSLERAAAIAGIHLTKETGCTCTCGDDCGGYCRFKRVGMEPAERAALSAYLRLDCEAGVAIVQAIREEGARSDYVLKGTIGGTAYATAKRTCGFQDAEWTPDSYALARSGYYGGRVELYRPAAESGWSCDLISAYPWALGRTPLPVGERIVISGDRAARAFRRGKEGIYEADVYVPAMFVPPLPYRMGARVLFPIGYLQGGAWTRIELAAAIAEGCEVRRWSRAIVWEDAAPICAPFVDQAFGRRAEAIAAGNAGLKEWHKLVANSFTGKCAQQPEMERVLLWPELIKLCPAEPCQFPDRASCERCRRSPKCCSHKCRKTCGAYIGMDPAPSRLWSSAFFRIPDCGHVHWSAYLTAATRIEWRAQALADGQGGATMVYGDTDSIFSTERRERRLGADLGDWNDEGAWIGWHGVAPKVYSVERALPDGFHGPRKRTGKAKGVSDIDPDDWDDFAAGEPVPMNRGVLSFREAARRGGSLFTRRKLTRRSLAGGVWFGGRRLGSDGRTWPTTTEEFEDGELEGGKAGVASPREGQGGEAPHRGRASRARRLPTPEAGAQGEGAAARARARRPAGCAARRPRKRS